MRGLFNVQGAYSCIWRLVTFIYRRLRNILTYLLTYLLTYAPDLFCSLRSRSVIFGELESESSKNQSLDDTTAILATAKRCLTKR